ncbi:hypothetical protein [Amycolatopsis sp. cmx-4-54]
MIVNRLKPVGLRAGLTLPALVLRFSAPNQVRWPGCWCSAWPS